MEESFLGLEDILKISDEYHKSIKKEKIEASKDIKPEEPKKKLSKAKKKIGRPKSSKTKSCPPPKGLRLRFYKNVLADNGEIVSGTADQYGRLMKTFVDENGYNDIGPTGICITATH